MIFLPLLIFLGSMLVGRSTPVENRSVHTASFLNTSANKVEVVFFGYVGCAFICPTALNTLGEVIEDVKKENPEASLGAYFVDVNAETQVRRAHQYSQFFSDDIVGVNVNKAELDQLKRLFGITVVDTNRDMNEIIHTDHFFVVKHTTDGWRIARVLSNESNKDTIKEVVDQVLEGEESNVMLANF